MAQYKQVDLTGTVYTRANRVYCDNPISGNPSISFHEQRIATSPLETLVHDIGDFRVEMTPDNLGTAFSIVDSDMVPTGATMTYQEVYAVLQSLYLHLAQVRDQTGL